MTGEKSSSLLRPLAHPVTQVLGDRRSDGEVELSLFFTRAGRPSRNVMLRIRELLPMNALYSNSIFHSLRGAVTVTVPITFVTETETRDATEHAVHAAAVRFHRLPNLNGSYWLSP